MDFYLIPNIPVVLRQSLKTTLRILWGYFPTLRFTHRLNDELQWFVQGNFNYHRWRTNTDSRVYINNVLAVAFNIPDQKRIEHSIDPTIGFTWLSKAKTEGSPLTTDLDGLKKPLLEKNQIKTDLNFTVHRNSIWVSDWVSWKYTNYDINTQVTYGLTNKLQTYLLLGITPTYRYAIDFAGNSTHYINPISPSFGTGITYRPRKNFEIYFKAFVKLRDPLIDQTLENPIVHGLTGDVFLAPAYKAENYNIIAGQTQFDSINYIDNRYADIVLGATWRF